MQQSSTGTEVDALLLAEPVLATADAHEIPPLYTFTKPNTPSALSTNVHLATAILYRTQAPDVTFTDNIEFKGHEGNPMDHMGLTVIEMLVQNEPFPSVYIVSAYLPNRSAVNTVEYITSLEKAIVSTIDHATKLGCPLIMGVDANCPFKEKRRFPPSPNSPVLRRIIEDAGRASGRRLVVMNWEEGTTGFHTRSRAGQASHQLDLFMVTDDIAHRCKLSILEDTNFDSDHCLLSLQMSSNTPTKAKETTKTVKKYKWTEQSKLDYKEALRAPLMKWREQAQRTLAPNTEKSQRPNHETVDKAVKKLVKVIIEACDATLNPSLKTTQLRQQRAPATDGATATAIRVRKEAREAHSAEVAAGESKEAQTETATAYATARTEDHRIFARSAHEKHRKVWAKMTTAFREDKSTFFKAFTNMVSPPRQPLPRSLRVNGEEIRSPQSIRKAWRERFQLPDEETGNAQDKQFRKQTDRENKDKETMNVHENASYNKPYEIGEIQHALNKGKLGKKTGLDTIQNEMLKFGGEDMQVCLTILFNIMHEAERVASHWKTTPQAPVYKKGDTGKRENYRPISFMSHINKTYERCIDQRIRATILLPNAQCGFRKDYGPLMTLTRTKIVMTYCAENSIDLYMVFIDFKQAFERVWRGGMLARLWKMGVKGKLWRVIKDMLTGTRSYVQTNFGDTYPWDVFMGITQGSVLSAILFIVFISPMSLELEHLSPTINGVVIPPQLFADDGTLFAVGHGACKAIIEGCMTWAAKWKMVLNMTKSKAMSLDENAMQLYADKDTFELVAKVVALGVGVDRRGVYSTAYLQTILARLVTKVRTIMQAGVRLGGLRADMGLHLYASLAQSIVKYALPLTASTSAQVKRLDDQQARFARDYLSLPTSIPPHAAKAELGLMDYDLKSQISKLMLHHRIHSSHDTFTRGLVQWDLGGHTTIETCTDELNLLLLHETWTGFTNQPYKVAKTRLKEAAQVVQEKRWAEHERTLGHATANAWRSKPKWGMERTLLHLPPADVITYIRVRNGAGISENHIRDDKCAMCRQQTQSEAHMLWMCESTKTDRLTFCETATQMAPQAMRGLTTLPPRQAFHYLMGAGAKEISEMEWEKFQRAAVTFVSRVFGYQPSP